jgi:hypothetical protein
MAGNIVDIYDKIRTEEPVFPTEIDASLKDLICKMLEKSPDKRIKMPEIKVCYSALAAKHYDSQSLYKLNTRW